MVFDNLVIYFVHIHLKAKIKATTVDKYLSPIREQICDLVAPESEVLEIGCGNGDLLFRLSPKVKYALGMDIDESLIDYANERKHLEGSENLDFQVADAVQEDLGQSTYDYAIVSLVLHVIKPEEAKLLVHKLIGIADQMIICGFCAPTNRWQRLLLWMDQRFSGHYANFKAYQTHGYMQGVLLELQSVQIEEFDTFDPVIKLYRLSKSVE